MAQYLNFTDALMDAKRRSRLAGRPISKQETAGIVAGAAETASSRAARGKALDIQEEQVGLQRQQISQEAGRIELQRLGTMAEYTTAKEARGRETAKAVGAGIGAIGGAILGGVATKGHPAGMYVGSIVGGIAGGALGSLFSSIF